MNIINRLKKQIYGRTSVVAAALTKRRWVLRVSEIVQNSPGGIFINDVKGDLHPLWWLQDPRITGEDLRTLRNHDYTRGDQSIPKMNSENEVSEFLAKWILLKNARNVLEVGSFLGFTSSHLALAASRINPPGKLTCIDIDPQCLSITEANVKDLTVSKCLTQFILGNSLDPMVLRQLDKGYDLIFIDSAHDEATTRREIELYKPLLTPGGAMAFHDAICWPGVRRAVADVQDQFHSLVFATGRGCGLAILESKA